MSLIAELRRRNVLRAAAGYIVGAWLIIQVVETTFPAFGLGDLAVRWVIIALAIGFIPAIVLAWVFEWTPGGLKRDKDVDHERPELLDRGKRFDRIVMIGLAIGLTYFAVDKFLLDPARDAAREQVIKQQARTEALVESYGDRSIVVLPFVNMSSDPEQEHFADGISEELLNLLAHSPQLRVISRSSAFALKGKDISVPEVAELLNVSYVLEGSVRRSADRLRITAQLIDARSDTHVWSDTYDRPMGDIFAIQDDVAGHVIEALEVELLGQPDRTTEIDPQAYALYLQARQLVQLSNPEYWPRVNQLTDAALAIQPDYAQALYVKGLATGYGDPERRALLTRAFNLDRDNPTIKSYMAIHIELILGPDADRKEAHETAIRMIEEAHATDPLNTDVLFNAARLAGRIGKANLEIALEEYVASRDPLFFWAQLNLAHSYFQTGRTADAVEQFRVAMKLNDQTGAVQWKLALALTVNGEAEAALSHLSREPDPPYQLHGKAIAYHALGDETRAQQAMEELAELRHWGSRETSEVWPFGMARAHAWLGQADEAFHYLDAAYETDQLREPLHLHPLFVPIHDDPRWEPFLRRVGLHPDQIAATEFDITVPR